MGVFLTLKYSPFSFDSFWLELVSSFMFLPSFFSNRLFSRLERRVVGTFPAKLIELFFFDINLCVIYELATD